MMEGIEVTTPNTSNNSREPAVVADGSRPSEDRRWEQFASRLAELEELVTAQFREFDDVLDRYERLLKQSGRLEQVQLQLHEQQVAWQRHCETVSMEIAEEYQHLRDAWERLEQEQRQAALSTDAPKSGGETVRLDDSRPTPFVPAAASPGSSRPAHAPSLTDLDIRDSWTPRLNDAAALQFQQMKRQIRTHVAKSRKKPEN